MAAIPVFDEYNQTRLAKHSRDLFQVFVASFSVGGLVSAMITACLFAALIPGVKKTDPACCDTAPVCSLSLGDEIEHRLTGKEGIVADAIPGRCKQVVVVYEAEGRSGYLRLEGKFYRHEWKHK